MAAPESAWQDAQRAAELLAVAPAALGGVVVRAYPGPVRDAWMQCLREGVGSETPWRAVPVHVGETRLLGGLDLSASLRSAEPVFTSGLLAEADGGILLLSMAERSQRANLAHVCAAMDGGEIVVEREGFSARNPARFGVVALDEGLDEDEDVAAALLDRVAFIVDLRVFGIRDLDQAELTPADIARARETWSAIEMSRAEYDQLGAAAAALEVDSPRPLLFAARAARIAAALAGRDRVDNDDLALAARLVLLPRTAQVLLPPDEAPPPEQADEPPPEPPEQSDGGESGDTEQAEPDPEQEVDFDGPLDDHVIAAASALLPPGVLESIALAQAQRARRKTQGKSGAVRHSRLRGRPLGAIAGNPRDGGRLNLLATLRAAAPWQRIRRRETARAKARVQVRSDDFRITRFKRRSESTVIFVVDASGSAALHRLAECKGAVELLLADCYVRRDRVALIAFRGHRADLLLPPTRSLVRAKRSLAALPGGGGTPLAAGIEAAADLADAVRRRGGTPTVVVLTDGRANVCRDGSTGRQQALDDALHCAAMLRYADTRCMVVDTAMRPQHNAEELARAMFGIYLPLPHADASLLSTAVRQQRDSTRG